LGNLKSRLETTHQLYQSAPDRAHNRVQYALDLYGHGQLYRNLEQVEDAFKLVSEGITLHPTNARLRQLRARIAMTLHRLPIALISTGYRHISLSDLDYAQGSLCDALTLSLSVENG
jgi:hypothetical protein